MPFICESYRNITTKYFQYISIICSWCC